MGMPALWNTIVASAVLGALWLSASFLLPHPEWDRHVTVAFVGNSMQYFNDFPRFMEALADGKMTQNSCLHGSIGLRRLTALGNGMYNKWKTSNAWMEDANQYDFGACTVKQLLLGYDEEVEEIIEESNNDDADDNADDKEMYGDGMNPCYQTPGYAQYLIDKYYSDGAQTATWDYVVLNDHTQYPSQNNARGRRTSLATLNSTFIPIFRQNKAIPILIHTHAYTLNAKQARRLVDVPTFTSLTYTGYQHYAKLLQDELPPQQTPRIAPVGIAYLTIWEENFHFWLKLFHVDGIHASPYGCYLQGCVVFHTIFGFLPPVEVALPEDPSTLWSRARRMGPIGVKADPFPTREEARYMYHIAHRVVNGYKPSSFMKYPHEDGDEDDDDYYE